MIFKKICSKVRRGQKSLIFVLNMLQLSVRMQTNHFTAYCSCRHQQDGKPCQDLWHSRSRFGTGNSRQKASAAPTQRTIQTRNWQNNPHFKASPLSPWLLIPALRSRAIWASSRSFSSFFSFSFWAIFFSTWALISTASLAYGNNQHFSMSRKYGIWEKKKKKKVHIMGKFNHSESHNQ